MDHVAAGLQPENTAVVTVRTQEGFLEVAEMIRKQRVNIVGYKVIRLLISCANLWVSNDQFEEALQHCISAIQEFNDNAVILLAATLPVPGDPHPVIEASNFRSRLMAQLAAKYPKLEFSKPGKC